MKTEYFPILTPDEGMMLYNASRGVYSDKVYVGRLDSPDNWAEVPMSQYEEWQAEQERLRQEQEQQALEAAPPATETPAE